MSRAGVIVTKYKLDSYLYFSQDLDLIVPMADKADDKNKDSEKIINWIKIKAQDHRQEKSLCEKSFSQNASFSADNENDDDGNDQPPSNRTRSEACTSASLELFHDFLGKLDERFSVLESAIHQMPSGGKEREQAHQMAVPAKLQSQLLFGVDQKVCRLMKTLLNVQRTLEGMIIA